MKEHLRYTPLRADLLSKVVPAYTARPGDTIEVFTHPDNKTAGNHFIVGVEEVRLYEMIDGHYVRPLDANIIGRRSTEGRVSIGGGTAIVKREAGSKRKERISSRQKGNIRITTLRF